MCVARGVPHRVVGAGTAEREEGGRLGAGDVVGEVLLLGKNWRWRNVVGKGPWRSWTDLHGRHRRSE